MLYILTYRRYIIHRFLLTSTASPDSGSIPLNPVSYFSVDSLMNHRIFAAAIGALIIRLCQILKLKYSKYLHIVFGVNVHP